MLSIIICGKDDRKFDDVQRVFQRLLPNVDHEIIGMKGVSSLTSGYNQGVRRAKFDKLIFCHDDIVILDRDFARKLLGRMEQYDILGIAGTNRLCDAKWPTSGPAHLFGHVIHVDKRPENIEYKIEIYNTAMRVFGGMQAMDGVFLATHRRVVERIPFDETTFDGFHMYDIDFTFRAYLAGMKLAVCADMTILHYSTGNFDQIWAEYRQRFNMKHRDRLAPKIGGKMDVSYNLVDSLSAARVYIENPLWEPLI
jgi:GT2 family glycosyltransferase